MQTPEDIASSFDTRAASYNRNQWHRQCAERLIAFCNLGMGQVVLDSGTGTGFAAVAAARAIGPEGKVVAVDLSAGMLAVAAQNAIGPDMAPIEWFRGNAARLHGHAPATFNAVVCAAALLYMPVRDALAEWHRLLKPGGTVAFSSMRAGSPLAGHVFRECAAALGLHLSDPSAPLGDQAKCHDALQHAGFVATVVARTVVSFSAQDRGVAWESNLASAAHAQVRRLDAAALTRLRTRFENRMAEEEQQWPGSTTRAEVLLARGVR
jgi:ubiquinone/menaquinone biosynthesis C-methylase UbiE